MTAPLGGTVPPVALLLMRAARWFDTGSLAELERRGWPRLSPAQSLLFAHLEESGTHPAELARRLGTSRQATHDLVKGLCRHGLLSMDDDPHRRGGRLVQLTPHGRQLVDEAYGVLMQMESAVGVAVLDELRARLLDVLERQRLADAAPQLEH